MPRRPSGADKKQKPAKKQGGRGRSRNRGGRHGSGFGRSTPNSVLFAASQHCQTLWTAKSSAKTIDGSLPGRRSGVVLDENYGSPQWIKRVRKGDLSGVEFNSPSFPALCRHPRSCSRRKDVDGRDEPGHDGALCQACEPLTIARMLGGYVYILASIPNGILYVGVTNDLVRRVYEHRCGFVAGFTRKYSIKRLVYFEHHETFRPRSSANTT